MLVGMCVDMYVVYILPMCGKVPLSLSLSFPPCSSLFTSWSLILAAYMFVVGSCKVVVVVVSSLAAWYMYVFLPEAVQPM